MSFFYELIVIIVMIIFNAFFAAYEMALASVSRARLAVLAAKNKKGAVDAAYMKDKMEASLAVVQVGITLVGAIAAATGGAGVTGSLAPQFQAYFQIGKYASEILALIILVIPLSAFTIVFAELIPKMYALNHREMICLALSPFMRRLAQVSYPIITVLERLVKWSLHVSEKRRRKHRDEEVSLHELSAAVSLARASRLIGAREEKIVLSAAQLSVRPIKDIIISSDYISMIPIQSTLTEAMIRAHLDLHTRFPVVAEEGNPQTIQGYINFKDIIVALKANPKDPSINAIIRPIKTVDGQLPISQVLEQMMQERLHIALVGDGKGKVIGMVTLEDIIEELVGEIEDEYDRLPTYIYPYGSGWLIGGGVPLKVIAQTANVDLSHLTAFDPALRLADWCEKRLNYSPKGGEVIEDGRFVVMVRKLRRKKVGEAIVSLKPE
jgi:putative hemolysin